MAGSRQGHHYLEKQEEPTENIAKHKGTNSGLLGSQGSLSVVIMISHLIIIIVDLAFHTPYIAALPTPCTTSLSSSETSR